MLSDIPVYNLGLEYYPEYTRRVEAVTETEIKDVAKKYLRPDEMIVIAVGDRSVIESGLRGLGFGSVEILDSEGNSR